VEVLSDRALNRATLARQLLLERSPLDPLSAIQHLVGLQAQVPTNPHVALWSRLDGFTTQQLDALLLDRRGAFSCLAHDPALSARTPAIWPLEQPYRAGVAQPSRLRRCCGVDLDPLIGRAGI
jgi:hypothetical protein